MPTRSALIDLDGHHICIVTSETRTCSESQVALTLVVLISQLLGNAIAILYPVVPRKASEWFAAAAYLTMTFSTALDLAIAVSGSTLQFLFESVSLDEGRRTFGTVKSLHITMVVCSIFMWLTFWVFHSRLHSRLLASSTT